MRADDYMALVERLPFGDLDAIVGSRPLVVLAPHPDDETLGCGGLIAAAHEAGHRVEIIVLTDGSGSHPKSPTYPAGRLAALRRDEASSAAKVLGLSVDRLTFLDLKDAAAPHAGQVFDETVSRIADLVTRVGAGTLFVTWKNDPHCDHEAASLMADAVGSRLPGLRLWHYPIWGLHLPADSMLSTHAPAGFRFDITPWLSTKRAAIACHRSQMTRLIDDDPDGFCFDDASLAPFLVPFERFIGTVP